MSTSLTFIVASAALVIALPVVAQEVPSNAELFEMLKAQQQKLASQEN